MHKEGISPDVLKDAAEIHQWPRKLWLWREGGGGMQLKFTNGIESCGHVGGGGNILDKYKENVTPLLVSHIYCGQVLLNLVT